MKNINQLSLQDEMSMYNRRRFLKNLSFGFWSGAMMLPYLSAMAGGSDLFDTGAIPGPADAITDALQSGKKLGVALVGLGKYSEGELGPALEKTKLCKLAGIVTGTPEKANKWKKKYNVPDKNVYNYQTFDRIADNPDIDIVYIVLPNPMHEEYVIRAAKAGKHVICEKPMAMTVQECQAMIDACKKADRKLSIGYRLHFEPHHQNVMQIGQNKIIGDIKKIICDDGQVQSEESPWRLGRGVGGGGPVRDLGVYCTQAAIYTKGEIPVSVIAKYHPKTDVEKFKLIEEGMNFQFQFADGSTADCKVSFNEKFNKLRAEGTKGWLELDPAYEYKGIEGKTSSGKMDLPNVPQQTLQMDDFANCIISNKPTRVPGEMGMRDVGILQSIFEAAETGNKVKINVNHVMDPIGNKK
ncbi:Gfo/Idh/MocA family oxidoreductase [Cytophagaceae bacterium YF14B1]|uniref:Gfo/Idh/MocA family oxidoreductase n=1 Tax=Xanthocytophaga flava TaxID=3048013 RepID=A0AAE3U7F4_9BACT|nr:Gfo/Idh/MocA family oxidoreductase [Xanthocytophaga flavus]MDJ1480048.1 Gfo/Idh/MocA family oxidoreductase [Xanthocytophaga flavus]